ncbi:unnamed protein product [Pleuronectes platessa]|uniref:Uncharacterized protein n=1 Tax=Pleuronectes platessa TaxID=8262 RepID=A0A9N7VIC0_PLEPL|nr:unnamed protein product [Pleuronectes platessa]
MGHSQCYSWLVAGSQALGEKAPLVLPGGPDQAGPFQFSVARPTPPRPPRSPSPAPGCGCSGGLGPDEAEEGSTAALSLWLPAPSVPTSSHHE